MKVPAHAFGFVFSLFLILFPSVSFPAGIELFVGAYVGQVVSEVDGKPLRRDMSVVIKATKAGFIVTWTTHTFKSIGRTKAKTYEIEFIPSKRENIYRSAMKTNLFGKAVPLDPMAGEPFVWARLEGDTLSVFSLFIDETGEYEIQEFHRSLVEAGLELFFKRIRDGKPAMEISTVLERQN